MLSGLPSPTREFKFHPRRRWRFDFAWPIYKVAVEVDGGIYSRGRHGPRIRGVTARAFKSGYHLEDLFALGAENEAHNNFDPGRGIGKRSANVGENGRGERPNVSNSVMSLVKHF